MKKNRNIKFLLTFILSIVILSCAYEEDIIKNHLHTEKFKIEQVKYNQLIKTNLFNQAIKRIPKKKVIKTDILGRSIIEEQFGFTIIDAPVKIVEFEGKTTYTIQIITDDNTDGKLENLVLYDIPIDNEIGYIIRYNTLKQTSRSDELIVQDGIDEIISLTYSGSEEGKQVIIRISYNIPHCTSPVGATNYCGGDPNSDFWSPNCSTFVSVVTTLGSPNSGLEGFGNNNSNNSTGTTGDGTGSGSSSGNNSGTNSTYDPTDPNIHGNGSTSPVSCSSCPELEEEVVKKTPCESLKKIIDSPIAISKITELEGTLNQDKENGYAFQQVPSTGNLSTPIQTVSPASNSNIIDMKLYTGGDFVGAYHTHPNPQTTGIAPMFAPKDIEWLFKVARAHNIPNNQKDYSDYFLTITTGNGTFAIKINDWIKFANFMGSSYPNFQKELKNTYEQMSGVTGSPASVSDLTKELLKQFRDKDSGIGLFELSSNKQNWSEVVLDPTNENLTPLRNPCN